MYIYIYPIGLFPFSQFYLYVWFVDAHSHPMNPPFQAITEEHLGRTAALCERGGVAAGSNQQRLGFKQQK